MKLFLKRDVSANYCGFTVYDELGKPKYFSKLRPSKTGTKQKFNLVLFDTQGNRLAKIRQLSLASANTFVLRVGKSHITFVVVITSKGIYSYFYGNNWHIHGNIATKNFNIIDVDNSVISSQRFYRDSLEITINDEHNELYCILTSICACFINTLGMHAVQTV